MYYNRNLYAGFWKRLLAYIIDQIIISMGLFLVIAPLFIVFGLSFIPSHYFDKFDNYNLTGFALQDYDDEMAVAAFFMLFMLIGFIFVISICAQWLYYALMESSNKQATIGKMILGIVVTDMYGRKITFGKASGRYFGKIISKLILNIGYIIAAFTEKKQALHDLIAGCLVVNKSELLLRETVEENQNFDKPF